jgi:dTDP-4-amino-4,6-dideoxygalactose transaminase
VGLRSFAKLSQNLKRRRSSAEKIKSQFLKIEPKLRFQHIPESVETTYKDLSVYIDPKVLGYTRDELHDFFKERGVATRKYFYPPLHLMRAYKDFKTPHALPVTERIATSVLSLPMYAHLSKSDIRYIVSVFKEFTHARN